MKHRIAALLATLSLLVSGCTTTPQAEVALSKESLSSKTIRYAVAMTPLPKVDTNFPGAGCLLCLAAASVANRQLTDQVQSLKHEDLPQLKDQLAKLLRNKGLNVRLIDEPLVVNDLPSFSSKEPNFARQDFSSLKSKYNVDKLLVIDITALGVWRNYSAYIPSEDPKAVVKGSGYIVNLSNNSLDWYVPLDIKKSADGRWDEPPKYPGLTNAYFSAIELSKDALLKPFAQ